MRRVDALPNPGVDKVRSSLRKPQFAHIKIVSTPPCSFSNFDSYASGDFTTMSWWVGGGSCGANWLLPGPPKLQSSEINQNKTVSIMPIIGDLLFLFIDQASRCFDTDNRFPATISLLYVSQVWPSQKYS